MYKQVLHTERVLRLESPLHRCTLTWNDATLKSCEPKASQNELPVPHRTKLLGANKFLSTKQRNTLATTHNCLQQRRRPSTSTFDDCERASSTKTRSGSLWPLDLSCEPESTVILSGRVWSLWSLLLQCLSCWRAMACMHMEDHDHDHVIYMVHFTCFFLILETWRNCI